VLNFLLVITRTRAVLNCLLVKTPTRAEMNDVVCEDTNHGISTKPSPRSGYNNNRNASWLGNMCSPPQAGGTII
jgi:hypothetical protein